MSSSSTALQHRYPYLVLVIAPILWGGNAVAGKLANGIIPPSTLTALRWIGAVVLVGLLAQKQIRKDWPVLKRHGLLFMMLGVLGYAGFNLFLYKGLTLTTSLNISLVQATIPMFILLGSILLAQSVRPMQWLGAAFSIAGVVVVVTQGDYHNLVSLQFNQGDLFGLGACVVYAIYSLGLRYRPAVHWASFLFMASVGASLAAIAPSLFELGAGDVVVWSGQTLALIIYVILGPSIVAQLCFIFGVEAIGAARAGLFISFVPIFGALLSVLIVNEQFELYHLVATLMVATGIVISEIASRQPTR